MKNANFDNILSSIKHFSLEEKEQLYDEFTKILSTTEFSSQHSYIVFKTLISFLDKNNFLVKDKVILEIGSGKYSLFTGLLWLSESAKQYIAIDKFCEPFINDFWKKIYKNRFDSLILHNVDLKEKILKDDWSFLKDKISIFGGDFCELEVEDETVDFCFSMAVFEHLENPEKTIRTMNKMLKIGGISYHNIDLRPHRGNKETPLSILKYTDEKWEGMMKNDNNWIYLNRLRKSDWLRLFKENGFEILFWDAKKFPIKITDDFISLLDKKFQAYSADDLSTSILNIFVKKIRNI